MKKLSFQKLFCFLSFLFILSCCLFYGIRFAKLYLQNKKIEISEKNSLIKVLRDNNSDNEDFKSVNGINYFTGKTDKNYLSYMNILWRIIKVNDDNSLTIISDKALSHLAYGKVTNYTDSYINKWLNKSETEYSGILENLINKEYLSPVETCSDKLDELTNNPCKDVDNTHYLSLLSVVDYLNIGSKDSYLANNEYFYLSNMTTESKVWYVSSDGSVTYNTGLDILGIRPIIKIKANVDYVTGNGTKDNPYIVGEKDLFGSYVKLGNDTWRIYDINDKLVKLSLNDYLKVNNKELKYRYSNNSSYHNDTVQGSIAYYLNHDFLNTLSYKDKIGEIKWSNGYYNSTIGYDYTYSLKDTIDTKVAMLSIGNIFLNGDLENYYTMTGSSNRGSMVYAINADKKIYAKQISNELNIVPTISIEKSLLTKGNGTKDSPFEME